MATRKPASKRCRHRHVEFLYEALEPRCVLAAIFPAYIDGVLTLGDPNGASPYPLEDTFKLESLPGADKVIYLDYDGHHSVNNDWGHDIQFPAFDRDGDPDNFSDDELIEIQKNFQNVAEDFLPYNVNVTLVDPGIEYLTKSGPGDTTYGVRAVATQATDGFGNGIGGIAFLNSFDDPIDNPVFAFNKGANNGAMTISHEVGHSLGLSHDGLGSQAYHPGVGSGPTSWGPIMGAPFGKNVTQWSAGDYPNSTNTEDDHNIITKPSNGLSFRTDDYGSTLATASLLEHDGGNVFQWGFIERPTDVDVFEFVTGSGNVSFDINPLQEKPNLDIEATLYDQDGNVIAVSNPADDVVASFNLFLNAGTYYLAIDGVGAAGVYPDYGSLGFYSIEGTIIDVGGTSIGEAGVLPNLNHVWQTVTLEKTYENPVVVVGPATRIGGDPLTVRVRNVTSSSFEVQLDEWDYRDGRHTREQVGYMVFEAGEYQLIDGTIIKADNGSGRSGWTTIDMSESSFTETPLVFTQVVTTNGDEAVTTRVRNIGPESFQVRIQEQQANAPQSHTTETVSYIAITPGGGDIGSFQYEASSTGDVVTHKDFYLDFQQNFSSTPVLLANMQTYDGGDPATIRLRNGVAPEGVSLFVEEERSADFEVRHTTENVGYFAVSSGFIEGEQTGGNNPDFIIAVDPDQRDGYAGMPDYRSTDKPHIWAALERLEAAGEPTPWALESDGMANLVEMNLGDHGHDHVHDHTHDHRVNLLATIGLQDSGLDADHSTDSVANPSLAGTTVDAPQLAGSVDLEIRDDAFGDWIADPDQGDTPTDDDWTADVLASDHDAHTL